MSEVYCGSEPCPLFLNSTCVFYTGESLLYIGVQNNDTLEAIIVKINQAFQNAGVGYAFTNGLIQPTPFQPVQLGGALIQNTTIGGNFTLTFSGNVQAARHITTGGSSSQFVKGDGTLDPTAYQPAANYITGLSGDATASGPGVAAMTLATVNFASGTFGNGNTIPIVTVNSKGLVTNITPTPINLPPISLTFVGDVVGSGLTGSNITLLLQNVNANPYNTITPLKFTVNGKGLVTSASPITASDIVNILGYNPGTSGTSGSTGTSGSSGTTGTSGTSATSGTSGTTGTSGTSATSGTSGTSGTDGTGGTSGTSGSTGTSGTSGTTGTSGSSGTTGTSGSSGTSGTTGTSGSSGTSGTTGTSGSSGLSGDRFKTTSTTTYTLQAPGGTGTITVGLGLAYSVAQSIIIAYDANNHNEAEVTSYDPLTGSLSFIVFRLTGSGTYSVWSVNVDGASGGDGSSGSSGTTGTSGSSGTSGTTGTSGSSGTSGTTGTSGSSGTSGTSATNGTGGTSGTSGTSGTNGTGGTSGTSGSSATSGTSGTSGVNGAAGSSGTSGATGASGTSGTSGTSVAVSGTTNTLAKFTSATTIGNSIVTDNGSLVSIGGALTTTGNITGAYILGSYFNASAGNSENPTIGQIWTQNTSDNYLRKSTPAHFRSQITDGVYVPISGGINMTGSFGLNDSKLYLRTNGDNNHYLWNAGDDWEELNAYEGTGFRVTSNGGATGLLYVYGSTSGGYTYSPYSFRAPIFYDSNDTTYYGDFASTSDLNALKLNGLYLDRNEGAARGINWYTSSFTAWTQYMSPAGATGCGPTGNINAPSGALVTSWALRSFIENVTNYGWTFESGSATGQPSVVAEIRSSDGSAQFNGSVRSPIFYDSNNTGYYLDPASTSNLNVVQAASIRNDGSVASDDGFGIYWDNGASPAYGIFREAGAWGPPFPDLLIAFHTGIKLGANATYNGIRFYDDYTMVNEVMSVNNASSPIGASHVYVNNVLQAGSSLRAPIFYDSDDTGYYADFNSTSSSAIRLRGGMLSGPNTTWGAYLQVGGNGHASASYANVVTTDGNLHLDPASTKAMYLNYYVNGLIYLNGTTYYISSNGASYNGTSANTNSVSSATGGTYTWTGAQYFQSNLGGYSGSLAAPPLQAYATGGNSAFMSFHRSANYAVNFGLDADNVLRMGGWSAAADRWVLDMSGNNTVAGSFRAPIFYDSNDTTYYLDPASGSLLNGVVSRTYLTASNCDLAVTGIAGQITLTTSTGFGGYFRATQHIVIENTVAGYHVYVIGSNGVGVVKYYNDQFWSAQSDVRIKTVHSTLENNLSKLENINPIYYSFNNFDDDKNRIGLIAQEVQEHFPELVNIDPKTDYLTVNYTGLIPVLLGAIKELKNKVETLETQIQ